MRASPNRRHADERLVSDGRYHHVRHPLEYIFIDAHAHFTDLSGADVAVGFFRHLRTLIVQRVHIAVTKLCIGSLKFMLHSPLAILNFLYDVNNIAILDDAFLHTDCWNDAYLGLVFALDLVFNLMQSVVTHAFLSHRDLFKHFGGFLSTIKTDP